MTPSQAAHLAAITGSGYLTFLDVSQAVYGDNPSQGQTSATTRALNALIDTGQVQTSSDEHANTVYYTPTTYHPGRTR